MVNRTEQIKEDLLAEGAEDYLGLWQFLWEVRETLGICDSPADREKTLELVLELLEQDLIEPGFPVGTGPGFAAWRVGPSEAMRRINEGWDALDDDPFTGDVVWFVTTKAGKKWLQRIRTER